MTKDGIQEVLSKDTQEKLLDFFENGSLPPDVESDDPFYKQAIHSTRIRPVSLDHKTAVKLVWLINARVNWPQFLHTKTVTDAIANEFSYQELKDINQAQLRTRTLPPDSANEQGGNRGLPIQSV